MIVEVSKQDSSPLAHSMIRGLIQLGRIGSIVAVFETDSRTSFISMDLHAARMVPRRIDKRIYVISVHCAMSAVIMMHTTALLEEAANVNIRVLLSVVNFLSDRTSPLYHVAIFLCS